MTTQDQGMGDLGWFGLGRFGLPIARHCVASGYRVHGFTHRGRGTTGVHALRDAAAYATRSDLRDMDALVLCLPRPADVAEVLEQCEGALPPLVIDASTGSPRMSRALHARLARSGVRYVDIPVSGSVEQAARGELTVMVGAHAGADPRLDRFVRTIAANACWFGAAGAGNEAKLINQAMHLGIVGLIAEGFATARALGLDAVNVLQMLRTSSGGSRMLDRFGASIVAGDFTPHFTLELACKDLKLATEMAAEAVGRARYLELTRVLYDHALARGLGRQNFTVVCRDGSEPNEEPARSIGHG